MLQLRAKPLSNFGINIYYLLKLNLNEKTLMYTINRNGDKNDIGMRLVITS